MILVVGSGGFLGRRVVRALSDAGQDVITASHGDGADLRVDLSQPMDAFKVPGGVRQAVILSSITALDDCFRDPVRTGAFNVTHTCELITALQSQGVRPVFVSSDVVFDGARGNYQETDPALPTTEYGRQKRAVEQDLEKVGDHLVVRLGKLYTLGDDDNSPVSGLVQSLKSGKTVRAATDQYLTPTVAEDVADGLAQLIAMKALGPYHLVPVNGAVTRYEMAKMVALAVGAPPSLIQACSIADFDFAEPRSRNCTLNGDKFHAFTGRRLRPFDDVVRQLS